MAKRRNPADKNMCPKFQFVRSHVNAINCRDFFGFPMSGGTVLHERFTRLPNCNLFLPSSKRQT